MSKRSLDFILGAFRRGNDVDQALVIRHLGEFILEAPTGPKEDMEVTQVFSVIVAQGKKIDIRFAAALARTGLQEGADLTVQYPANRWFDDHYETLIESELYEQASEALQVLMVSPHHVSRRSTYSNAWRAMINTLWINKNDRERARDLCLAIQDAGRAETNPLFKDAKEKLAQMDKGIPIANFPAALGMVHALSPLAPR